MTRLDGPQLPAPSAPSDLGLRWLQPGSPDAAPPSGVRLLSSSRPRPRIRRTVWTC